MKEQYLLGAKEIWTWVTKGPKATNKCPGVGWRLKNEGTVNQWNIENMYHDYT
jgi:hypothetical protein